MSGRDIIGVGASAGGVEALIQLVRGLPADLPAAVLIVLHISPFGTSRLPEILNRHGALPAAHAEDGEPIEHGRVYIAPPDRHLLVRDGHVELSRGPRENGSRPAVDPLFRSASRAYGGRVVGVVLSGALTDGSMGLVAVRAHGGVTIVQEPDEALVTGMPLSAIRFGSVDYVLPVAQIAATLVQLATRPSISQKGVETVSIDPDAAPEIVRHDLDAQAHDRRGGQTAVFSCPDCGGVLWQVDADRVTQFRCHVGHTYASNLLMVQKSENLETALWSCVRLLVEKAILSRQMATQLRQRGQPDAAARADEKAQRDEQHTQLIRQMLLDAWAEPAA